MKRILLTVLDWYIRFGTLIICITYLFIHSYCWAALQLVYACIGWILWAKRKRYNKRKVHSIYRIITSNEYYLFARDETMASHNVSLTIQDAIAVQRYLNGVVDNALQEEINITEANKILNNEH